MARKRQGPSLRARWLGEQLREARETAGMTLRQAADFLQVDPSMVSKFETAVNPARKAYVLALLDLYAVSDRRRREVMVRLSEDVWQKGWWTGHADAFYDRQFVDYPWLEARAERICSYNALTLPGLTQTREYAEAVIRKAEGPAVAEEQIDQWVALRMSRQQVLDADPPKRITAVLDESTLRRPVGGPAVMRTQLTHLVTLLKRPSVELRVLPFGVGEHAGFDGAFTLFEMSHPYPDVAYVESLAGRVFEEETLKVDHFQRAYDDLYESSLGPEDTAELISAIAEGMT